MACREGINSVIVSIAYFLTKSEGKNSRADDSLVKRAFHALRYEEQGNHETGMEILARSKKLPKATRQMYLDLGNKYPPANKREIVKFLESQRTIVRTDPRVPERKRALLTAKLNDAITKIKAGEEIPTVVVLSAWRKLIPRVERMRSDEQESFIAGSHLHGIPVTRADIDDAIKHRDDAIGILRALYALDPDADNADTYDQQTEIARMRAALAEAELHTRILTYDTTDVGFKELLSESDDFNDLIPLPIKERQHLAQEERRRIFSSTTQVMYDQAEKYRTYEREYLRARHLNDKSTMDRLSENLDHIRYEYGRTIMLSPKLKTLLAERPVLESSVSTWAGMLDDPNSKGPTRREQWIALETYAGMRDQRLVRMGTITPEDAQQLALQRTNRRREVLEQEK